MSETFDKLLDATITHLEELREKGVQHVPVSAETLQLFRRPAPIAQRPNAAAAVVRVSTPPPVAAPVKAAPAPPAPTPTPVGGDRSARLEALARKVLACTKCPDIVAARTKVVFGVGNPNADLMFVGEAPGADEDLAGEPFVGKAGQLLDKIIHAMGLDRQHVYIANILKCRPDTPGQSAGNRKPTPDEMKTCIAYLQEQIDIIQPKVLVALGATAVEGLLGNTVGITKLRGNWREYRGIPLMPTYHPAYLLRNQAVTEKRKVWEDMLQVMERLGLPISEKQKNFFTRS